MYVIYSKLMVFHQYKISYLDKGGSELFVLFLFGNKVEQTLV